MLARVKSKKPMVVPLDQVPVVAAADAVTRVRIARTITRRRCGSELMQGVCWMDPGEQTNTWSSRAADDTAAGDHWYGPVEETYFIVRGDLRLRTDAGVFELHANDSVYLAPGHSYHLENTGTEPAFFVYSMTPSQE
jgi:mannose-6-phosphate isomerase-like protein (cupin superfamily)